jgi:SPX domain protein involved in polyphosphate accumulation
LLNQKQYELFLEKINNYIVEDKYFKYKICSIYFDTNNYDLIRNSLEKPIYKEKVRIRSYGKAKDDDKIFFEIKKKYKGITNKRRTTLTYENLKKYLNKHKVPDNSNIQIFNELDYLMNFYELKPKVFISYDRISFISKENKNLRITFDTNLNYRLNELNLEKENGRLFNNDKYILEIKTLDSFPIWLVKALSELKIYPTSFSKYGSIYKKYILKESLC